MNKFVKILKVAGVIVGIALVGIAVGFLGSRPQKAPPATSVAMAPSTADPTPATPVPVPVTPLPVLAASNPAPVAQMPAEPGATDMLTNYEEKLDAILTSDKDESEKARQLLDLFPHLPEDGQIEVASHLSNLLSDQDYPSLAKYMTNSTLPGSVMDVLMAGLLNRPNSLKLPLLLDIARNEQNPKAPDARELLQLFLEDDYGNDWAKWQARMNQWLQDNPD